MVVWGQHKGKWENVTLCASLSSPTFQSVVWKQWLVPNLTLRKGLGASAWHRGPNPGFGKCFCVTLSQITSRLAVTTDKSLAMTSRPRNSPEFAKALDTDVPCHAQSQTHSAFFHPHPSSLPTCSLVPPFPWSSRCDNLDVSLIFGSSSIPFNLCSSPRFPLPEG